MNIFKLGTSTTAPFYIKQSTLKMGHVLCRCAAHTGTDENMKTVNASPVFMFGRKCAINAKEEDGDGRKLRL